MTEDELRQANGLVAHARRLEREYLRTRSVKNGDELYKKLDGIRWTLRTNYGVSLPPFKAKLLPDNPKGAA